VRGSGLMDIVPIRHVLYFTMYHPMMKMTTTEAATTTMMQKLATTNIHGLVDGVQYGRWWSVPWEVELEQVSCDERSIFPKRSFVVWFFFCLFNKQ
jgi:hypothetical protein